MPPFMLNSGCSQNSLSLGSEELLGRASVSGMHLSLLASLSSGCIERAPNPLDQILTRPVTARNKRDMLLELRVIILVEAYSSGFSRDDSLLALALRAESVGVEVLLDL